MNIEKALDYCVEVYDITNLLCLKKRDNIFQEMINHIRYLTNSDQILYIRLMPHENRGTYYTYGLNENLSMILEQVNKVLTESPKDGKLKCIKEEGMLLTLLFVPYAGEPIGVFAVLSEHKLELKKSFFEEEYKEHTPEMLELQGALPFFLNMAGIVLKKYEFNERNELYFLSDEQQAYLDHIRLIASQKLFIIASRLYLLSNPARGFNDEELRTELAEVKQSIDKEMKELRDALHSFAWQRKSFYTSIKKVHNPSSLLVLVNKFYQLPEDFIPDDLEKIEDQFNPLGLVLRHEAKEAFETMCRQAQLEGIRLEAISTFRSYEYQNKVYFKNMTPDMEMEKYQAIRDKVSARAGHSEHQTGLAVDINDLEQTFEDTAEGKWLAINSHRFGYILRYPKGKEHLTGYDYEPWHFRYLGLELAEDVYQSSLTYDEYYHKFLSKMKGL